MASSNLTELNSSLTATRTRLQPPPPETMAITGTGTGDGAHILVFPYPAQGHMLALLDLTHQLAIRDLSITILVTPKNLSILTPLLSAHPTTVKTLILPLPPHPSLPAGVENVKDLPAGGFSAMMVALGDLYNPLLDWFRRHPSPPVAIISDMFLGWTHRLAAEIGIRRYTFSPSGAFGLSVIYSLWRYLPKRQDPTDENAPISFPKIPNSPIYPWWQVSPVYRSYVQGNPNSEFIKEGMISNLASCGLVVNSFTELERVYLDHLKDELGDDRVFAVGPLLPPPNNTTQRGGPSSVEILSWLDTCPDRTVVYVCFGTQAVLTNKQMEVLALGLEKSGVHFVWKVKGPTEGHVTEDYGKIPLGFEDRVAGRGIILRGWAPQVAILSHKAVAAFLFHGGWNSAIEALTAGVVMLTWPMGADQFSNATLIDELAIGIRVCEGVDGVPDSDELARVFVDSVSEKSRVKREQVSEFASRAKETIEVGGNSWKELNRLVRNMTE